MAFGPPIELAMEVPQFVPSPFRPELKALKELPTIKDATTETIRLEGTLSRRLPPMPGGALQDLYFSDSRQREAAELMAGIRTAWATTKQQEKFQEAKARARGRQQDRALQGSETQGNHTRKKLQGQTKRMERSAVLRNARDYLGMGTDLYR